MKLSRKLIPAFAMLLVSAVMLTTASYAWFSINDSVTAEGMNVRTTAADNVLIAESTLGKTDEEDDANFGTTLEVDGLEALLNPVSTINGTSFFYTAGTNVKGDGSVKEVAYSAYNDLSFQSAGAVGYVDYIFQVKVTNAQAETQRVILNGLTLTYGETYPTGSENAHKAFRVAVFAETLGVGAFTEGVGELKTILAPSGAEYQTGGTNGSAVNSTTSVAAVTKLGTAAILGEVAANSTDYVKVVVRLWLEGEDTTCKNETFANLAGEPGWNLSLRVALEKTSVELVNTGAVKNLATATTP
ncbi:MAG: hypothetical protein IKC73_00085 [Clostridia bacterium]|nr:hypothetical protein [Clostridia bacterium]